MINLKAWSAGHFPYGQYGIIVYRVLFAEITVIIIRYNQIIVYNRLVRVDQDVQRTSCGHGVSLTGPS